MRVYTFVDTSFNFVDTSFYFVDTKLQIRAKLLH